MGGVGGFQSRQLGVELQEGGVTGGGRGGREEGREGERKNIIMTDVEIENLIIDLKYVTKLGSSIQYILIYTARDCICRHSVV